MSHPTSPRPSTRCALWCAAPRHKSSYVRDLPFSSCNVVCCISFMPLFPVPPQYPSCIVYLAHSRGDASFCSCHVAPLSFPSPPWQSAGPRAAAERREGQYSRVRGVRLLQVSQAGDKWQRNSSGIHKYSILAPCGSATSLES